MIRTSPLPVMGRRKSNRKTDDRSLADCVYRSTGECHVGLLYCPRHDPVEYPTEAKHKSAA